ncbi:hypothetical protein ACFPM3_18035 [Streptomyces coeruleoprunus]|uniref:Uncharacterized protein n=1 Tax=Streptomyces coeruleoprunus TaxID=285563 RepID=A0ABV9XIC4_9ACTN
MPDPVEIALISSAVPATLTFLYQRLERLLSPRRTEPEPDLTIPDTLVGTLELPLQPNEQRLHARHAELDLLHDFLEEYVSREPAELTPEQGLLRSMGKLRNLLEDVYGQRLTFAGEARPASGPFVDQKLTTLTGEATGMDADEITSHAQVTQQVETVDAGAKLIGMKARRIGG